jgi:UDP-N-acetylmuramate--alanine ligase
MVSNATAALAVAWLLGLDLEAAAAALTHFAGVKRRFETVFASQDLTIVDDYGHHPTEIAATLAGVRDLDFKRTVVIFQPHRYTRTEAFAPQFASAFTDADLLILMDVYSAGETPVPGVSGRTILNALLARYPRAQLAWLPHRAEIAGYLDQALVPGDILLTMGAGDVTEVGRDYAQRCEARREHA